jgi:hypothetical protein
VWQGNPRDTNTKCGSKRDPERPQSSSKGRPEAAPKRAAREDQKQPQIGSKGSRAAATISESRGSQGTHWQQAVLVGPETILARETESRNHKVSGAPQLPK